VSFLLSRPFDHWSFSHSRERLEWSFPRVSDVILTYQTENAEIVLFFLSSEVGYVN
jgi:hypothetical protein